VRLPLTWVAVAIMLTGAVLLVSGRRRSWTLDRRVITVGIALVATDSYPAATCPVWPMTISVPVSAHGVTAHGCCCPCAAGATESSLMGPST